MLSRPFSRALSRSSVSKGVQQLEVKASVYSGPYSTLMGAYPRRTRYIERSAGGLPRPVRYNRF